MTPPTIRLAAPADAELVRAINARAYIPAYQAAIGAVPKPAIEDYTDRIRSGEVWVAETGNKPGAVLVLERGRDFLMVYSVAVDPDHQRKGIGKALLEHAERRAVEAGLPELRLYTNTRMERNVALYRRCGFVEIGERPHPTRKGEVLIDMAKRISGHIHSAAGLNCSRQAAARARRRRAA